MGSRNSGRVLALAAIFVAVGLVGCGGGGGGGGGGSLAGTGPGGSGANTEGTGGSSSNPAGSWLSFSPAKVDLTVFPNTSTPFGIIATSSKTIAQQVNVAIVDNKGVISGSVDVKALSALKYSVGMTTNAALAPGTYTGNFEVRVCYDANPAVCAQPVDGSPWQVPYTIRVIDRASLSYSRWESAQTTPGFLANFALSTLNGKPYVVSGAFYSGVMETWVSSDIGSSWTQVSSSGPPPPRQGFALASDDKAIYMSGGRSMATYANPSGQYQSDVWKFDGTHWQQQTPSAAFAGRENQVMAKVGSTLYVAGGSNTSGTLHDLWASPDEGAGWTKVADTLPAALGNPTCALSWQNSLLLVGDQVVTSPDGVNWTVHGGYPPSFPKGGIQCAVLNGRLFINAPNYNSNAVSSADLENWQIERPMATAFNAPGMAAINGRLLITTGQTPSQRTIYRTVQ